MEATGKAMNMHARFNNWLFESEADIYLYWSESLRSKYCKYFGHNKINKYDEWHCDRCFACLEHEKATCEY